MTRGARSAGTEPLIAMTEGWGRTLRCVLLILAARTPLALFLLACCLLGRRFS
jgi:hypothetical protein